VKAWLERQSDRALVFVDWATREHIVASRVVFFAVCGLLILSAIRFFDWSDPNECTSCDAEYYNSLDDPRPYH